MNDHITYDDEAINRCRSNIVGTTSCQTCPARARCVELMQAEAARELSLEPPPNGWISVDDELPPEGRFVRVCRIHPSGDGYRSIPVTGILLDGQWKTVNWFSGDDAEGITHWMPLPDPPEMPIQRTPVEVVEPMAAAPEEVGE